ncbi:hypothetical protein PCAR4_810038 [Paraburkholderia caribensis]|nr:hypothetical protein PCAR4_810038 [Paraburkholderia caribensis]
MRHPRVLSATADHLTLYRDNGFLTPDLEPRFSAGGYIALQIGARMCRFKQLPRPTCAVSSRPA